MKNYRGKLRVLPILGFLLTFPLMNVFSQTPEWVSSYGTNTPYSGESHVTGFGMSTVSEGATAEEMLAIAEANSRSDLIQKITVDVSSLSQIFEEETNGNYSSQTMFATETSSNLSIYGLSRENHVDGNRVYVLTSVSRENLFEQYESSRKELLSQFTSKVENGRTGLENGNKEVALNQFIEAKPLYAEIIKAWMITRSLESPARGGEESSWTPDNIRNDMGFADQQINELTNRKVNSLEDAVWVMVNNFGSESEKNHSLNMGSITFEDSGISSVFANFLRQNLLQELGAKTNWNIVEANAQPGQDPTHILTGTFWKAGNTVDVLLNVREIKTGTVIASSNASINQAIVEESGLQLIPDNYENAVKDLEALKENKGDSRGLNLEVWTTKGSDQLVYEEGELMEVSLQVNIPSYIRILYHLNDGTRVLLTDSHFINERAVNKSYTLPYQFECVAPFGVEMMQVIAQTEPFERVQTKMVDGIPYLSEDLEEFLSNTRGFKIKKQEAQQAEEVLTITTMPKLVN